MLKKALMTCIFKLKIKRNGSGTARSNCSSGIARSGCSWAEEAEGMIPEGPYLTQPQMTPVYRAQTESQVTYIFLTEDT